MERTTDLNKLKKDEPFTWGEIIGFYELGCYTIASYHPWKYEGVQVFVGNPSDEIEYHAWIDGKDTSRGYSSLESAIVGTIAYKHDGNNSQAGEFFMRMIGAKE